MTPPPTAVQLRNRACVALGVRLDQLQGPSKHPKLVVAREVAITLLRDNELLSFREIASMVRPGMGHSPIIKAYERGKTRAETLELVGRIAKGAE